MDSKVVFFCFVGIVAMVAPISGYEFEHEEWNMECETLMKNDRLVNGIRDCLMSDEPECGTVIFTEMKKYAPEILATVCAKCTDKQKEKFKSCTNIFIKIRPEDYEKIMKKMDPETKYRGPLEEFLKS